MTHPYTVRWQKNGKNYCRFRYVGDTLPLYDELRLKGLRPVIWWKQARVTRGKTW